MERHGRLRRHLVVGSQALVVAAAMFASAQLGLVIGLDAGRTSPFWPPTGIAVAALLLLGVRMWPGILAGSVAINVFTTPYVMVVPTAVGTTVACLCAYQALRRAGFRVDLGRLKDAFALVFLAAFGAMLISSTIGTVLLLLGDEVTGRTFLQTWLTWWTGDAMGVLVVTPLLLVLAKIPWRRYRSVDSVRLTEITALLAATVGLVYLGDRMFGVLFVAFPLLVWAAWRFQLPGAAPVGVLASAVAIHAAVHESGTFAGREMLPAMVILQLFNGSIALTGLLLSVAVTERKQTREELERTCGQLGQVIEHLDEAMRPAQVSPLRLWAERKQGKPRSSRRSWE